MSESDYQDGPAEGVSWDALAKVHASDYRQRVLKQVGEEVTPSTLAERMGIKIPHVSRTLSELRDMGFVELLVSEDTHKGRIYGRTDAGDRLSDYLENHDN